MSEHNDAATVDAMMTAFFGPHWKIPAMKEFARVNAPKMARALAAVREREPSEMAALRAERDALASALGDLLSWFPAKPSQPEWRIQGGENGADEAVAVARSLAGLAS